MTSELLGQLREWLTAKYAAAASVFALPADTVRDRKPVLVASEGNVLDMGKRYRLTSGHAPLLSLFTFFTNR